MDHVIGHAGLLWIQLIRTHIQAYCLSATSSGRGDYYNSEGGNQDGWITQAQETIVCVEFDTKPAAS